MQATWASVAVVVWCFLMGVKGKNARAAELSVARANNDFALQLYQVLMVQPGNLLFSPLSAHAVLSMAYVGASGATARELAEGLSLKPKGRTQIEAGYQALMTDLKKSNCSVTIDIANKVYTSAKVKPAYRISAEKKFLSEIEQVNFVANSERVRKLINNWTEGKTRNRIKNLLPEGSVDRDTEMVLVNALYFKGEWANTFKNDQTYTEKFKLNSVDSKPIRMMRKKRAYMPYAEYGEFEILRMDYSGGNFSMVVLLPKEIDGVADLEASIPTLNWDDIDRKISEPIMVDVFFPKFKVEKQIDLKEPLKELGIRTAFRDDANFFGMVDSDVCVSKVVQKSFIEVTENGTEAAVATAVERKKLRLSVLANSPPPVFRADHPFIFLLRHGPSRAILFFGRFSAPE